MHSTSRSLRLRGRNIASVYTSSGGRLAVGELARVGEFGFDGRLAGGGGFGGALLLGESNVHPVLLCEALPETWARRR